MFIKGVSGNSAGRPPGSKNKVNEVLRESITDFMNESFDKIKADFDSLKPYQRVRYWIELLNFSVPKLSAMTLNEFERLSDEELDELFTRLTDKANEELKNKTDKVV